MPCSQLGGAAKGAVRLNAGLGVRKLHLDVCVGATQQRVPTDTNGCCEMTSKLHAAYFATPDQSPTANAFARVRHSLARRRAVDATA
jgi:hypothetical protein